jgi:hypothetical protein
MPERESIKMDGDGREEIEENRWWVVMGMEAMCMLKGMVGSGELMGISIMGMVSFYRIWICKNNEYYQINTFQP